MLVDLALVGSLLMAATPVSALTAFAFINSDSCDPGNNGTASAMFISNPQPKACITYPSPGSTTGDVVAMESFEIENTAGFCPDGQFASVYMFEDRSDCSGDLKVNGFDQSIQNQCFSFEGLFRSAMIVCCDGDPANLGNCGF